MDNTTRLPSPFKDLRSICKLVVLSCLMVCGLGSTVTGVESAPAQAETRGIQLQSSAARDHAIPADWTDHRDVLNGFRIGHPAFMKKAERPGVLYAAAGSMPDGSVVALVIDRETRERSVTEEELKGSVQESLMGTTLVRKEFSSISLGGHKAFAAEVLYDESGEKWFSLVVSLHAAGYHYTIAVQASPFPDEKLKEYLDRTVSSFRLLE